MYSDFLKLCGFEPEEIERETPRINKAFKTWRIEAEDIKRSEERIRRFFDLELTGTRRFRGIWLKEFIDLTLAKEEGKKVIYASVPPVSQLTAPMAIMSEKVHCSVPEILVVMVMGRLFGKLGSVIELAEKHWLPPGQAHCPYLQVRLASISEGIVPSPDLLMPGGILCDQSPKTDDLIGHLYGVPVVHTDSCRDELVERWPHVSQRRVRYLAQELKNVANAFQQVTGLEFTEETINWGLREWAELRSIYDKINMLRRIDPLSLSENDWGFVSHAVLTPLRSMAKEGLDAASILFNELKERTEHRIGVVETGAPRVINLFSPAGDPAIVEVTKKVGLAVIANMTTTKTLGSPSEYESAWEITADMNLRGGTQYSAMGAITQLKELCRECDADGVIIGGVVKCRANTIFPLKAKEVIEKKLGIPVLVIDADFIDSREYSAEMFRSRVEPFAEMLESRKKVTKGSKWL